MAIPTAISPSIDGNIPLDDPLRNDGEDETPLVPVRMPRVAESLGSSDQLRFAVRAVVIVDLRVWGGGHVHKSTAAVRAFVIHSAAECRGQEQRALRIRAGGHDDAPQMLTGQAMISGIFMLH